MLHEWNPKFSSHTVAGGWHDKECMADYSTENIIHFFSFHFDIFSGKNSATSRSCITGVVETLRTFRLTREQYVAARARK